MKRQLRVMIWEEKERPNEKIFSISANIKNRREFIKWAKKSYQKMREYREKKDNAD